MFTNNSIANVALYLRKSRGDDESVLVKHRDVLESLCKSRNWRYVVYAEIGSGDSISMRPKMTQLLNDVELQMYDAVVVHDWERLGRGDLSDQDRIVKTFKRTSTKIVTANPYRVFDLLNEQDEQYSDFYSFLARQEYRAIKKRLIQGKKIGAKLGHWTNGTPPYPYEYNPETKGLIVNKSNKTYYRFIVESCLAGKSLNSIAWELNKMGVLSPRKKRWNENTIRRLLIDETHLGRIISNKTEGDICKRRPSSKDYKEFPREEWVIVDNCHEAVKTIEEHERILEELKKEREFLEFVVFMHSHN
jgi:DNA invertase Pin-like site-specific DNA recombinase